jgi:hypothetical protein
MTTAKRVLWKHPRQNKPDKEDLKALEVWSRFEDKTYYTTLRVDGSVERQYREMEKNADA